MKQAIRSDNAPAPIGPYSQAVRVGNLVFVSGQVPFDPATGEMIEGDIGTLTRRCMDSILAILDAAGMNADEHREDQHLPRRHGRLRRDERSLRLVLRKRRSPARARGRAARTPAERRTHRDRVSSPASEPSARAQLALPARLLALSGRGSCRSRCCGRRTN